MELMGVISALRYILADHKNGEVVIHADSTYVLGGVTTWIHNWEKNGWRTANKKEVLNQDLWKELIALVREFKGKLSWQKVKGHAGHVQRPRAENWRGRSSSNHRGQYSWPKAYQVQRHHDTRLLRFDQAACEGCF